METTASPTKKLSRYQNGKEIMKSSWRVFKLEPGLITIQLISFITAVFLIGLFFATSLVIGHYTNAAGEFSFSLNGPKLWALLAAFYLISGAVYAFFSGWFAHMVYERLDGRDPTIKGSLKASISRIGPLTLFGFINGAMNLIFEAIRNRTSFLGDLVSFIGQFAWSVASIFAIPIIVTRKEKIGPIAAVKESARLIKKTWGEGVVSQFGIALVGTLIMLGYILLFGSIGALAFVALGSGFGVAAIILAIVGIVAISVILSMLSSIAQTALYYYAQTGKSPAEFDKELMRSAMTPKKARKIFG